MRLLSRTLFREIFTSAVLGCVLFTSVLFLFQARPIFEIVVKYPGPAKTVARMFLLVLPQSLPYTIPLGVLVGVLLALSRKSADGEITAMRAAGVPGRRVIPAVLLMAFVGMGVAACASMWWTPWSIREVLRMRHQLEDNRLSAEIQPLSFEERFPGKVLYVRETGEGAVVLWKRVFLADVKPSPERGDIPAITLASEAIAQPDLANSRFQLSLRNAITYEASKDVKEYQVQTSPTSDTALEVQRPVENRGSQSSKDQDTGPLYKAAYQNASADAAQNMEARIEFNQRMALPFASMVLALAGIPLGLGSRRRGRSPAAVLTVALAFLYYVGFIGMINLARQATISAELAVWLPNIAFLLLGVILMLRLERPGSRDYLGVVWSLFRRNAEVTASAPVSSLPARKPRLRLRRWVLLPQVIDSHLTSRFLFYFALWLVSFILLLDVFTFFELLSDMIKNRIPMEKVFSYLFFLTPRWVYQLTPVSVLTSCLVVLGVLSKDNEITAYKACGVSVYRLAAPIFLTSLLLSAGLFAFNHFVVPNADRKQNQLRAEIQGRPAQTYFDPGRKWIYGQGDRVFYYRYYDPNENVMGGVNVFEIDPATYLLKRHIFAASARWEPAIDAWVFQNGWSRDMKGKSIGALDDFAGKTRVFGEIEEKPDYFIKEVIQSEQMNYKELEVYIAELQQSGLPTTRLQVQFFKKFSVPLFAFILALVSVPFAFSTGTRGAMAGVGVSFIIFIAYSSVSQLFEQVGNLNQLPPAMAAWSPDAVFALAGIYFLARVRS
ncbi:MAG: LptF/LptG family permease [Acidobacteriota bacterium]